MLESLLVALIVAAATVYAVWALTPVVTRNRLALRLATALERRDASSWLAGRLRSLAQAPAGGCANCPSSQVATPAERASQRSSDRH
jgi:hypothetical protein